MSQIINPVLIDIPMPIETPRLRIEPVAPGHGTFIHEMKNETWDQLLVWMPFAYTERDNRIVDTSETVARKAYADFILRTELTMIAFENSTERPVAMTGLHHLDWHVRSFEIGFWVRSSAQGQGYATEIANALTRFAFKELDARRVAISHADGNENCCRVVEKLGFRHEAFRENDAVMPDGRVMSHHEYIRFNTDNLPALDVRWPRR